MDDLALWSVIVGFLSPLVIATVQQPQWTSRARALVTFAYSLVAGGLTAYFGGDLNGKSVVTCVLVVLVAAITTYKGLWQPMGTTDAIENATSPRRAQ